MPKQIQASQKRLQRAHRILDAAAALVLRWGYDKTAVDDIARAAGVAKGTIYLHWQTREELFLALLMRENFKMMQDMKQSLRADPDGFTLRSIFKHASLAILQRPLQRALFIRDADVVGKLVHSESSSGIFQDKMVAFGALLALLREHGLVRDDLAPQAQMYMLSAIFMGFLHTASLIPDGLMPPDEQLAEMLAETVHCTFEPAKPVPPEKMRDVAAICAQKLDQSLALMAVRLEQALNPKSTRQTKK